LRNIPEGSILQISMIGYQLFEVRINKSGNNYSASAVNSGQAKSLTSTSGESIRLQITLSESASQMDEVTISTGIVNRKAESFTGASITVKGDELRRVGNQNIFQSLKNLDPTVYVM